VNFDRSSYVKLTQVAAYKYLRQKFSDILFKAHSPTFFENGADKYPIIYDALK
jgi:hypothetical protein